jgi:hypothetical protein
MKTIISLVILNLLFSCSKADDSADSGDPNQAAGGAEEKFSLMPTDLSENAMKLASSNSPSFNSKLIKNDQEKILELFKTKNIQGNSSLITKLNQKDDIDDWFRSVINIFWATKTTLLETLEGNCYLLDYANDTPEKMKLFTFDSCKNLKSNYEVNFIDDATRYSKVMYQDNSSTDTQCNKKATVFFGDKDPLTKEAQYFDFTIKKVNGLYNYEYLNIVKAKNAIHDAKIVKLLECPVDDNLFSCKKFEMNKKASADDGGARILLKEGSDYLHIKQSTPQQGKTEFYTANISFEFIPKTLLLNKVCLTETEDSLKTQGSLFINRNDDSSIKSIEIKDGYSCDKTVVADANFFDTSTVVPLASIPSVDDLTKRDDDLEKVEEFASKDYSFKNTAATCRLLHTKRELFEGLVIKP